MQQISATITKYTMVLVKQQVNTQVVVLYDSTTQTSSVITTGVVQAQVKPYYVTTTEVEGGTIIDTNSVTEITTTHTEATAVLQYSNTYLQTSTNWEDVSHIQVVPSPVIGGNIIYVIETKNTTSSQKIEISYNSVTQAMTVVTLIVKPVAEIHPTIQPLITIDIEHEHAEVSTYVEIIKTSQTTRKDIQKIVSVTKEVTSYYEKVFVEAITQTGEIEYVTLIVKPNEQPVVVSVEIIEEGEGQATEEASSEVETVDTNGNTVVVIHGSTLIKTKTETKVSYQSVISTNVELQTYDIVEAQTIDYGTVKEVKIVLVDSVTHVTMESIVYYHVDTNEAEVISIQPVEQPVGEETVEGGIETGEGGIETGEGGIETG